MPLYPARAALCYNVVDFGADPRGVADSTSAIAAARAVARQAGGGIVFYPPGTYISGNQDFSTDAKIYHCGSGKQATVIKLKDGANTDLFSAQTNLISLSASSDNGSTGTLYDFGFSDLTLDGNKANQSSGPSWCLRFYGLSYIMENIEIRNGYSGGCQSDWYGFNNTGNADSMMAFWDNVKIHDNGGMGLEFGGPHDSIFSNIEIPPNTSHNLHICPRATGLKFSNCHWWQIAPNYTNQTTYDSDTFVRANQSGLGTSSTGETWTESPGSGGATAAIVSHQANFTGNGTASSYFREGSGTHTDMLITTRFNLGSDAANNSAGVVMRYTDSNNFYTAYFYAGSVYLQKTVGGTLTVLGSAAFTASNSTYYWIRGQVQGTTLKVKIWQDGQVEPPAWNVTCTDSALASGGWGLGVFVNTGPIIVDNFFAQSIPAASGIVTCLDEAYGCLFSNCVIESSDTVQLACLGSGTVLEGGNIYDATNNTPTATGIKMGQQAGETPYAGQILQSAGVTTAVSVDHCRISTYIQDNHGDNGSIWLDNDGGYNNFDCTITVDLKGTDKIGSLAASSNWQVKYDDGTHTSEDAWLLNNAIQIQKASTIYSGSGVPASTLGANGDFYFRTDTPGTANQRLYVKSAGAWSGIL